MTCDEETRLWIKTHLRQIERPEEVEDYLRAYRYLDSRRDEITKDAEIEVHGTLRNDGAPVGHKQVGHGGATERATPDALRPLVAVGFGTLQEVVRYVRIVNTKNFCEFSGITIKKTVRIRLIHCPISVFLP